MISRRSALAGLSLTAVTAALPPERSASALADPALRGALLGAGVHRIADDLTIGADLLLLPGARVEIAAGRTLTLLGDFAAPIAPVFTGPGRVDLTRSRCPAAFPEWWGAVRDDPAIDCLAALDACIAAHVETRLGQGRYHISDTWKIGVSDRRVIGSSASPLSRPRGTEIVLTDGRRDVLLIGRDVDPGGVDRFPEGIDVRRLRVTRTEPVVPPPAGAEASGPAGVRMQFVLRGNLEDVAAVNHSIGFVLRGTARSFVRRCEVLRNRSGKTRTNDFMWGFYFDGDVEFGFAGGNASIYVDDCFAKVEDGPALTQTTAAYLRGAFCDTFLYRFESAAIERGIVAEGAAHNPKRALQKSGNGDLHIHMPILDGCTIGMHFVDFSDHALVEVVDPYVAVAGGGFAGLYLERVRGLTTVSGGQLIGYGDAEGGGNAIGVHVVDAEGFDLRGLKLLGFRRPVGVTNGRDFALDVAINNPEQRASQGAVGLVGCARGRITPRIKGGAGMFPQGIFLFGPDNHALTLDTGMIDPASVGGPANLIASDAHYERTPGRIGDNRVV